MVNVWSNMIQIVNEVVVLTCVWMMFLFSNYVPKAESRYDLAYFFLYVVAADVVLNVLYLIYTIVQKIYLTCRNVFTRRRAKK